MIDSSTILMLAIAIAIGYIDDVTGPQPHHYKGGIVIVDKKYQCPTYCGIDHNHSVYYTNQSILSCGKEMLFLPIMRVQFGCL